WAFVARFGSEGELLHDRANGVELNPFRPRRAPERLALALPIEPAVAELDSLRFVLHPPPRTPAADLPAPRSRRPSPSWVRCGSSSTASPGRWPISSRPAAPPPRAATSGCHWSLPSPH